MQLSALGHIVKKTDPVSVKNPDTDEIHVPWGTMAEELKALGLINGNDDLINNEENEDE